jgi:rubrerythrin
MKRKLKDLLRPRKKELARITPKRIYVCPSCGYTGEDLEDILEEGQCINCGKRLNVPENLK